jgi:uncharacterized protein YecT (DUF1311 family)
MLTILAGNEKELITAGAALSGGLLGWFGRGLGFWLARRVTGAGRKEHVDYLTSVAGLMSKMRADGTSVEEVAAFGSALRSPALVQSREVASIVEIRHCAEIDRFSSSYAMRTRASAQLDLANAKLMQIQVDQRLVLEEVEEEPVAEMHKTWTEYRRALMEAAASEYSGGTIGSIVAALVGIAETERRSEELQSWVVARVERLQQDELFVIAAAAELTNAD